MPNIAPPSRILASQIDQAIIGESARWGDAQRNFPRLRSDWLATVEDVRNNIIAQRNDVVLQQLRNTTLQLKDSRFLHHWCQASTRRTSLSKGPLRTAGRSIQGLAFKSVATAEPFITQPMAAILEKSGAPSIPTL